MEKQTLRPNVVYIYTGRKMNNRSSVVRGKVAKERLELQEDIPRTMVAVCCLLKPTYMVLSVPGSVELSTLHRVLALEDSHLAQKIM